ncbi:MAG: hypothetical protein ACKVQR_04340 [Aquabacterium sp.]
MANIAPAPKRPPGWAGFLRDQAQQTSTRSGIVFMAITAAGATLTDTQTTTIMAVAGAVAAIFGLIFPDRSDD